MRTAALFVAVFAVASSANGQTRDDDFSKNVVATFTSGLWQAQAAEFKGYTFSPQVGCRMYTRGAVLTQTRPNESGRMDSNWTLLQDRSVDTDNFQIDWIQMDRVRYETTRLPWRLVSPPPNGIILSYDLSFLAVRRDKAAEWLPASYLTLPLLDAGSFEVGFHFEKDDQIVRGSQIIPLKGFKQAAKWCGRQLLRDRLDQKRVDELTR